MASFNFRLESLRKIREAERDRRREDLGKAFAARQVLRNQQEEVNEEMQRSRAASRECGRPGDVDIDKLMNHHRHALMLKARLEQLGRQIESVDEEIENRRRALSAADQQVKVLEKLRAKQFARHKYEQERNETKRLDEIAAIGHMRAHKA
jgi:flagellar export protein FliJ